MKQKYNTSKEGTYKECHTYAHLPSTPTPTSTHTHIYFLTTPHRHRPHRHCNHLTPSSQLVTSSSRTASWGVTYSGQVRVRSHARSGQGGCVVTLRSQLIGLCNRLGRRERRGAGSRVSWSGAVSRGVE